MEQRAYYSIREVTEMICNDRVLVLTALDETLSLLPTGNWIGGISNQNEVTYNEEGEPLLIQVNDLSPWVRSVHINSYQSFNFESIEEDAFPNGFSIITIPAFSSVHLSFAIYSATTPTWQHPVIGWIAGSECGMPNMRESVVVDGGTGEFYVERVVVMHCALYDNYKAWYDIINPFEPDLSKPRFKFPNASFNISECSVLENSAVEEGVKNDILNNTTEFRTAFKTYANAHNIAIDAETILITQLHGEYTTTSILMNVTGRSLILATPVIPGLSYYIGKRCLNEEDLFTVNADSVIFSVNCFYVPKPSPRSIASYGEVARFIYNHVAVRLHVSHSLDTIFGNKPQTVVI
ncbi:MAG: DUF6976 family protein [Bacteroides sp.]